MRFIFIRRNGCCVAGGRRGEKGKLSHFQPPPQLSFSLSFAHPPPLDIIKSCSVFSGTAAVCAVCKLRNTRKRNFSHCWKFKLEKQKKSSLSFLLHVVVSRSEKLFPPPSTLLYSNVFIRNNSESESSEQMKWAENACSSLSQVWTSFKSDLLSYAQFTLKFVHTLHVPSSYEESRKCLVSHHSWVSKANIKLK